MPLWFASMCGRHEIAELLLTRGADVNASRVRLWRLDGHEAEDEKMKALCKHRARLTVETCGGPGNRSSDSRRGCDRVLSG